MVSSFVEGSEFSLSESGDATSLRGVEGVVKLRGSKRLRTLSLGRLAFMAIKTKDQ